MNTYIKDISNVIFSKELDEWYKNVSYEMGTQLKKVLIINMWHSNLTHIL